jgi:hypothetical protein
MALLLTMFIMFRDPMVPFLTGTDKAYTATKAKIIIHGPPI